MSVNNKCVNLRLSHLALLCTQNEEEDTIEENNTVYKSLLRRKYKWMKTGKGKNIHIYILREIRQRAILINTHAKVNKVVCKLLTEKNHGVLREKNI